jgi:hypothetical protein
MNIDVESDAAQAASFFYHKEASRGTELIF